MAKSIVHVRISMWGANNQALLLYATANSRKHAYKELKQEGPAAIMCLARLFADLWLENYR